MTNYQSALSELLEVLRSADEGEMMRRLLESALQMLTDAEASARIGAEPHQRTPARVTQRNGHRDKTVSTTSGDVRVAIPKLRAGSFFPSLLQPRRRVDKALHAVICEAYVQGVSTRKVDELAAALGIDAGISKSTVSDVCQQLDADVAAWRDRRLDHTWFPYVFLDATYVHVRLNARVVSQAIVVATGVTIDGHREILGHAVGDNESEPFWAEFLTGLRDRGLAVTTTGGGSGGDAAGGDDEQAGSWRPGVQLVISDAHRGLRAAIGRMLPGAAWQRCRVHFMRNLLTRVPKGQAEMVAATVRTIFAQPTPNQVRAQVDLVAGQLAAGFPAVAAMLTDAKPDITAFADFPRAHWRKVWSNNPIERLNREIKRRTNVVGIFPTTNSVDRLVGAVLIDHHDEWQVSERRYLSEASMAQLAPPPPTPIGQARHTQKGADTAAIAAA